MMQDLIHGGASVSWELTPRAPVVILQGTLAPPSVNLFLNVEMTSVVIMCTNCALRVVPANEVR